MLFLIYKIKMKWRVISMLDEKICKLRDELNLSIVEGKDYEIIYNLSIKLDKLIAEYYKKISKA